MELSKVNRTFILHWGEMGSRWGVNRTIAQIHALLMVSPQPMAAEEISDTLAVARSNVSTSLKELLTWGLISNAGVIGSRKDHFTVTDDAWSMFQRIAAVRREREIDPTTKVLDTCLKKVADSDDLGDVHTRQRLTDIKDVLDSLTAAQEMFASLPPDVVKRLVQVSDIGAELLGPKPKKKKKRNKS